MLFNRLAFAAHVVALIALTLPACATAPTDSAARPAAEPAALAGALAGHRSALLGEVHDNGAQHALRAAALRKRVEAGARPAIAFEQFDIERQADIDRVRRDRPRDADALIAAAGGGSWKWPMYRPFVELALDHDLPIVAANLSRGAAMKVAMGDWSAVFDADAQKALGLARLPQPFLDAHERAVAEGHCNLLPASSLAPMVRAQIARDITMARAIRPYLPRGVVLLAGNGHVRNDVGVPFWLTADERRDVVTVGLLEVGTAGDDRRARRFDVLVETVAAERPDPCEGLRQKLQHGTQRQQ